MTIEQAELLIASKKFQQLKYFQEKTNVFTIVGQTHREHWHSSFMSWLLDPGSSLCLGHYPLVRLLTSYMIKNEDSGLSLKEVFEMELDHVRFRTEKTFFTSDGKKRSIDVYGESDQLVLVIENKVKARENMNGTDVGQTQDYRDYVEKYKKTGQKVICLFITPDPKQKPYDKSYTQITYQEFYDYVIAKCLEHPQLKGDGRYLLEQYANNLREPVHGSPMALVNTGLCKAIYEEFTEQLDENKKPYYNEKGEKIGYYKASSQAGIDSINLYRKKKQIEKRIETLNGPSYWKTKDGTTIKELIDSIR